VFRGTPEKAGSNRAGPQVGAFGDYYIPAGCLSEGMPAPAWLASLFYCFEIGKK